MVPLKKRPFYAAASEVVLPTPDTVDRQPRVDGNARPTAKDFAAVAPHEQQQQQQTPVVDADEPTPPQSPAPPSTFPPLPVDVDTVLSLELEGEWVVTSNGDTEIGTVRVALNAELTTGTVWFCDAVTQSHLRFRMIIDPDPLIRDADTRPLVILDREYVTTKKFWRVCRWGEDGFAWKATVLPIKDEHLGWIRECPTDDPDFVSGVLVWTQTLPEEAVRTNASLPPSECGESDENKKKKKKRKSAVCYPPKWRRGHNKNRFSAWKDGKAR